MCTILRQSVSFVHFDYSLIATVTSCHRTSQSSFFLKDLPEESVLGIISLERVCFAIKKQVIPPAGTAPIWLMSNPS